MKRTKLNNAMLEFTSIQDAKELRKQKLSLSDYDVVFNMLLDLREYKRAECIQKGAAEWFKRLKFEVVEKGIGWEVRV